LIEGPSNNSQWSSIPYDPQEMTLHRLCRNSKRNISCLLFDFHHEIIGHFE